MSSGSASKRYTLVWHSDKPNEKDWIEEVFAPYIREIVTDTRHEIAPGDAIVCGAFIHALPAEYYTRFRGKNAFLVHLLDESYEGHYDLYQNFSGVFRNFGASVFNPQYVKALPLGPSAGVRPERGGLKRALERRYIWSFTGQVGKATRPDAVHALHHIEPHLVFPTDAVSGLVGFRPAAGRRLSPAQYRDVLCDSIFAPCPMGNINLESYRVYEALECGAIPIVERRLTLDYYRDLLGPHPLPTVSRWRDARRMIARLVADPKAIEQLQERCLEWWAGYKRSYSQEIGVFLAALAGSDSALARPMYEPRACSSAWQIRELLRHHNASAIARRIRLHTGRLVSGSRIRNEWGRPSPP